MATKTAPYFRDFEPLLKDGRVLSLRLIDGRYIATAVPLTFDGGPVHVDWRAEAETAADALGLLLTKWDKTPSNFQWPEESVKRKRKS